MNTDLLLSNNTKKETDTTEIFFLHDKVNQYNDILNLNLLKKSQDKKNLDLTDINKNLTELINKHQKSLNDLNILISELSE